MLLNVPIPSFLLWKKKNNYGNNRAILKTECVNTYKVLRTVSGAQ